MIEATGVRTTNRIPPLRIVVGVAVSLLAALTCMAEDSTEPPGVVFPGGRPSVEIAAEVFNNVVYLPVAVDGGETLDFALDTGAPELSVVNLTRATAIGLTTGSALTVRGADPGRLDVRRLDSAVLSVGGITAGGLEVVAMPLDGLEPFWGRPMDGILGGNFLRQVVTCIDYDRKRVDFIRPDAFDEAGRGPSLPIEVKDNTLFVTARITARDGGPAGEGRFLIDTGVRQSFLNTPFVRRHRILERSGPVIETMIGHGIGGPAFGTLGRLGSLTLGPHALTGPVVQLCTGESGIEASTVFDGIIGADLLSRFAVCFDYGSGRIHLEPGSGFDRPFDSDAAGLIFRISEDDPTTFTVVHVVESFPAAEAGVERGDVLLALDDRPAAALSLESLKRMLQATGEHCLQLRRQNASRNVCFALRPLI